MIRDAITDRFPALKMAYRNLSRTKVRSGLAVLGIIIGVIAIASLGVFGFTLKSSITGNLGDIGNQVIVTPSNEDGVTELDTRDIETINRVSPTATVVPMKQRFKPVAFDDGDSRPRTVTGVARPKRLYESTDGRIPDPLRGGVLVGEGLAEEHGLGPGSTITINGSTERVRAVVTSANNNIFLDPSNSVIVPASQYDGGYNQVVVIESDGTAANASAMAIRESLNDRKQRVSVQELSSFVDQIKGVFDALNVFLLGVGSISLLVAGVSILNVMLMSVVERSEEIGVLRAVGFQKRDVLRVMLAEAALLGVLGGTIGAGLSLLAGFVINHLILGDALSVFHVESLGYILIAFLFGIVSSVLSGLYPAWKAANKEPVEALRG